VAFTKQFRRLKGKVAGNETAVYGSQTTKLPQTDNVIRCTYTDPIINDLLKHSGAGAGVFTRHYNQVEEFFFRFDQEFTVPQLPIHHDVRVPVPDPQYVQLLIEILEQLIPLAPQLFSNLTYLFDPTEILRPSFYYLYQLESSRYLYLLKLDLMYRPQAHGLIHKGSNDLTAAYSSNSLFLEAACIPIREVLNHAEEGGTFVIDQTISNTWVDEIGRGYLVQGIWIDNDLTKFFSKLFLPEGKRTYPFYPYICKYKTICLNLIDPDPGTREKLLPYLHNALHYLRPAMPEIEVSLKGGEFSESNQTFRQLKSSVPPPWVSIWDGLQLESYLNNRDMKEYRIEYAAN
jgi:hypothetical protein